MRASCHESNGFKSSCHFQRNIPDGNGQSWCIECSFIETSYIFRVFATKIDMIVCVFLPSFMTC
ncbi:unnamed protein product [Periconia digitata]|uniref:Uncharacterized protein n=1 Tax=Periconia digitata TaxID=1303443 RepID=A0A9W4XG43_9PLEO|nr:unnamed protein product [Periconia digitata]